MVTAKSAIHPPALTGIGLDADHSSMVKYKSMLQKNYQLVRSELSELLAGVTLGPSLVLLNSKSRSAWLGPNKGSNTRFLISSNPAQNLKEKPFSSGFP